MIANDIKNDLSKISDRVAEYTISKGNNNNQTQSNISNVVP